MRKNRKKMSAAFIEFLDKKLVDINRKTDKVELLRIGFEAGWDAKKGNKK